MFSVSCRMTNRSRVRNWAKTKYTGGAQNRHAGNVTHSNHQHQPPDHPDEKTGEVL